MQTSLEFKPCLAMVVAQLEEQLRPTPEICASNTSIGNSISINCNLTDENKKNRGREWPNLWKTLIVGDGEKLCTVQLWSIKKDCLEVEANVLNKNTCTLYTCSSCTLLIDRNTKLSNLIKLFSPYLSTK